MDRREDHLSWPHGVANYYSSHILNDHQPPMTLPSTSFVKSHTQYQNYPTVRCPEPRRPYETMSYPPLNYYPLDNSQGSSYFSRNLSFSESSNQIPMSNYYSSYRTDFENRNSCIERPNIYQNTCKFNSHCVETCPNLDVRQFWSTWKDKDEDVIDNHNLNNQQNVVYHVQEPFSLDCTRRDTLKGTIPGVSKHFDKNYNSEQGSDFGFTSTPFYNIRDESVYKTFSSTERYNASLNHKNDSELYYSYRTKEAPQINHSDLPLPEQKPMMYTPYFTERSPYNLTSSLESDDHFDDINTKNEESLRPIVPLIHDRHDTVCCNENIDYNLRNHWSKIVLNNIPNEKSIIQHQRKHFYKTTNLEIVNNINDKITPSECSTSKLEASRHNLKNITLLKSEIESYKLPRDESLKSRTSMSVSSVTCSSEKCKLSNDEVSSEDIYISITSGGDLTSENSSFSSETSTTKGSKKNMLNISVNAIEKEFKENNYNNLTCIDNISMENNKINDYKGRNELFCLDKVMCDVQTQVRLSDFKQKIDSNEINEPSKIINVLVKNYETCKKGENEFNGYEDNEIPIDSTSSNISRSECTNIEIPSKIHGEMLNRLEEHDNSTPHNKVPSRKNCPSKYNFMNKKAKECEKLGPRLKEECDDASKALIHSKNDDLVSDDNKTSDLESNLVQIHKEVNNDIPIDYDSNFEKTNQQQVRATLNASCKEKSKLLLENSSKNKCQNEKTSNNELNDNLLLLANCSQKYRQIEVDQTSEEITRTEILQPGKKKPNKIDITQGIKCSLRWDRIFSNSNRPVNESTEETIDLGPAKVELRMPILKSISMKPQWRVARSDVNKPLTTSFVNVKRLILKRKFICKEKIPKMIIKKNDDKKYISYIKSETSSGSF